MVNRKNALVNSKEILANIPSLFHKKAALYNDAEPIAKGYDAITAYYEKKLSSDYKVETVLKDRISFKSFQIDREQISTPEGIKERLVIYQLRKDKIFKVWFLTPNFTKPNAMPAVNKLIMGYQDSNLGTFMEALATNIIECDFPGRCNVAGISSMRTRYAQYLGKQNTSYRLVKRISIGDFVVDDNYISLYLTDSRNIAIYQTGEKGKIKRIEFLGF